jgi:glycosyltransferase involved in cell wall biosynthesis
MSSRRPISVLHLRDSPWVDGPGRTILETAAHIDPGRIDYRIGPLCSGPESQNALLGAARSRGLKVVPIADPGRLPTTLVDSIVAAIDRFDVRVLHSSDFRTSTAALLAALRRKVRLVVTAHGWIANTPRRRAVRLADKALLRLFDRVVLVSAATRGLVPTWWLPERKSVVLHNALVLESYGQSVLSKPRPPVRTDGEVTLLNVGRLSREKGQMMLLHTVADLARTWPRLRLVFAGTGPLEQELGRFARESGLGERVEFRGYVHDMPSLYAECDLLVQSSFTEGLPNVILEAAYLRLPMVATDVGGTAEVVQHGRSAWLTPPTQEGLARGIEAFLRAPDNFLAMAAVAHADILRDFSFQARTQKMTALYEELIQ